MKVTPPLVKVAARELALPVYQPEKIRDPESVERLRALAPDFLVVVAYGQILPGSVLAIPRLGAVNVHASLLPRWRGAAPVARAILAGDHETGITLMEGTPELDAGPILVQERVAIADAETAGELTTRLAQLGATMLERELPRYLNG